MPGISHPSFRAAYVENLLSASVCNASMKIKGVCVMCAQRTINVAKRYPCRWSTHRELAYVVIQVRTLLISGSQRLLHLMMHNESLHHLYNILEETREEFNKIASVTGRHVRPFIHLQRYMLHFAWRVKSDLFPYT